MFAAWSCRICTSIVFEISKEAYFSMRLYCPLTHPFLGFLLGKLDRILGYIYSHGMIGQVNVFSLTTDFYFPATVLQFLSCFFAFHMFSL